MELLTGKEEFNLNGKPKGVATSVGETETKTAWIISETTECFQPTLYNYSNPNGYRLNGTSNDYWVINFNPNADAGGFRHQLGVE